MVLDLTFDQEEMSYDVDGFRINDVNRDEDRSRNHFYGCNDRTKQEPLRTLSMKHAFFSSLRSMKQQSLVNDSQEREIFTKLQSQTLIATYEEFGIWTVDGSSMCQAIAFINQNRDDMVVKLIGEEKYYRWIVAARYLAMHTVRDDPYGWIGTVNADRHNILPNKTFQRLLKLLKNYVSLDTAEIIGALAKNQLERFSPNSNDYRIHAEILQLFEEEYYTQSEIINGKEFNFIRTLPQFASYWVLTRELSSFVLRVDVLELTNDDKIKKTVIALQYGEDNRWIEIPASSPYQQDQILVNAYTTFSKDVFICKIAEQTPQEILLKVSANYIQVFGRKNANFDYPQGSLLKEKYEYYKKLALEEGFGDTILRNDLGDEIELDCESAFVVRLKEIQSGLRSHTLLDVRAVVGKVYSLADGC